MVKLSEDYEETEVETPPFEDIFDAVNTLEPGGELWEWVKYLSLVQRTKAFKILKEKWEVGITELKKDYESHFRHARSDEDPFWLKIYAEVYEKYGKKIVAMSDSRQLMLKKGNIYTPDIKEFTKYLSKVCNKYKTSYRNVRNDVLEKFKDSRVYDRKDFCYDNWIINFKNGYYDIKKNEFIKAKDNKGKGRKTFFYEIPHDYLEGDYKCPKFMDAVKKWLGINNRVSPKDMFQFLGYTMSMNVSQRKAFLIYGPTKSGKTQFQEILKYLIGGVNTSGTSLQELGENFGTQELEWKLLNVFDDLPARGLKDVSLFKIIAGGSSTIPIRRKFVEAYSSVNTVKLWYNTNVIPTVKSTEDDSFFNRWIIINFPNQFEERSENPDYEDIPFFHREIIDDPDEVQGIIHYCIKALRILYKNKHFKKELSTNSRKVWEYESDLLYAFLDKYTILEDGEYILSSRFKKWYNLYRKTRHISKRRPGVTQATLNKEMDVRGYERKQIRSEEGKRAYMGITFNKKFKVERKNNFKEKTYKTREDYVEEHPDSLRATNGEPELEHEDMGEFHFTNGDYNNKDRFNRKATKLIKEKDNKL